MPTDRLDFMDVSGRDLILALHRDLHVSKAHPRIAAFLESPGAAGTQERDLQRHIIEFFWESGSSFPETREPPTEYFRG